MAKAGRPARGQQSPRDELVLASQLAEITNKTQPKLLILYRPAVGPAGRQISDPQYVREIQRTHHGKIVVAQDLDV